MLDVLHGLPSSELHRFFVWLRAYWLRALRSQSSAAHNHELQRAAFDRIPSLRPTRPKCFANARAFRQMMCIVILALHHGRVRPVLCLRQRGLFRRRRRGWCNMPCHRSLATADRTNAMAASQRHICGVSLAMAMVAIVATTPMVINTPTPPHPTEGPHETNLTI